MTLIENNGEFWYVNPNFPDSKLSPVFDDSAYALQWRGRIGQENFGDIEALQKELDELNDGRRVVLPKSKEHAEAMLKVATFYLETHDV